MRGEHVAPEERLQRKVFDDSELVPDKYLSECDWTDWEALDLKSLTTATEYTHISGWSKWGLEGQSAERLLIYQVP